MKNFAGIALAVAAAVSVPNLGAQDVDDFFADFTEAPTVPSADATAESEAEPEQGGEEGETAAAMTGDPIIDAANALASKQGEKYFHILPYCRRLEGAAEVMTPGTNGWTAIKEGKFYPLGTSYRTIGEETQMTVRFGENVEVVIKGEASFGTRAQPLGDPSRMITLLSGTITVKLPRNLPAGNKLFVVTTPGFQVYNLAGDSRYTYSTTGDGDETDVRCVTGSMAIEGRHFKIPSMRAANEVRLRTSQDLLFTGLYGVRGDVMVTLEQGQILVKDYATGENHIEDKSLDWKLSPQTAVRIHRAVPALGERMSVTVMTFDASGEIKNRCAFAEKCFSVNTGEIGPTSEKEREAIAKRAAEVTPGQEAETVDVTPAEAEAPADDGADGDEFNF